MSSTDCLVLYLQDESVKIYIIYDPVRVKYCLWGEKSNNEHFYFSSDKNKKKHIYAFLNFVLGLEIDVFLFNFNNLPNDSSNISFNTLELLNKTDNLIGSYYNQKYNLKYTNNLLNILSYIR